MSFIETRLSDRVALGFQSVPQYDTRIVPLDNGKEKRNINRSKAKRVFSCLFVNFTRDMFDELLAAFHACRGSGYSFRFKDWMDYQATDTSLGMTPGNNSTPVQLQKVYEFGAKSIARAIKKPVAGTVAVYQDNGSGVFVLKPVTVDDTAGLVTPTTPWVAGRALRATFQFDTPVRFADDRFPASWDNKNLINSQCDLVEDFL